MSWEKVRLGDVCDVRDGTHNSPKYFESGFPLVTSRNIKDGKIDLIDVNYICEADFNEINKRSKVDKGDILLPMIGTIGNPIILNDEPNFAIKNVCLLKKSNKILNTFLYYVLISDLFKANLFDKSKGGTQKFISLGDIRDFQIPLPPLPIQKRIAEILDAADALKRKDQELLKKYDELAQAIFIDMFGDPVKNERGIPLSDLVKINPSKSELDKNLDTNIKVSFVPMKSVGEEGEFDGSEIKNFSSVSSGFTYFKENDVLFAKITPCMENGKGAIAKGLKNEIGFGSTEFHVLRPNEILNSSFLFHLTKLSNFRIFAELNMSGSAGQKRVPKSFFGKIKIETNKLNNQIKFEKAIENLSLSKISVLKQLTSSENLFNSLIQKAFKGELVS